MNILVLMPHLGRLEYALFGKNNPAALIELHLSDLGSDDQAIVDTLADIQAQCLQACAGPLDLVVIRCAYGGSVFARTTRVDAAMLAALAALASEAPMHVPPVHLLAEASLQAFAGITVVMAFETAFFVNLPDREQRYGIADDSVRRFGYHGLYHQAAGDEFDAKNPQPGGPTRTLSLCLEPQPEIAAIIGHRPVMVTSGATPLEGLPGETTCGELDPTIVLAMARSLHWGPEQINDALTRRSGLMGLLGRPARLNDLLDSTAWSAKDGLLPSAADGTLGAARNILAYRILLASGAAVATMGGLDRIVLTGRYAQEGRGLGNWLAGRLLPRSSAGASLQYPPIVQCPKPLSRILADQGVLAAYQQRDFPRTAQAHVQA